MKHLNEIERSQINFLALVAGRIRGIRQQLGATIGLLVIMAASTNSTGYASDAANGGQWNIKVVPAMQTVYSGDARERFNKNCASCHSQDGRAQTPVARQRHVQDLSECKLPDDGIVEQILEGTHKKTNSFRMPPFKEKLARAEVESLVPLVKAFRPLSPAGKENNRVSDIPRLAGIINFPGRKYAVLEREPFGGSYSVLAESESHDGITLERIKPKSGSVLVWMAGTNSAVTLKLDGQLTQPKAANTSGFGRWIAEVFNDNRHDIVLEKASTDLVLFLYAQFTGRTLLRSPRLPAASFDLHATADNQAQITHSLEKALAGKGISMLPDGEKFLLVIPTSEARGIRPFSSEIKSFGRDNGRPELFPGGVIVNFPDTELGQVVKLYAGLTERDMDQTLDLPPDHTVNFTTQTALSKEECTYALETLLKWQGLRVVHVVGKTFKLDPILGAGQ